MKILWITPWFGNYRIPIYKNLNDFSNGNFFLICNSTDLSESIQRKLQDSLQENVFILNSEKRMTFGNSSSDFANTSLVIKKVPGLYKKIKEINPDILIVEGFGSWAPYGIVYSILHRKKLFMFYERTKYVERNSPWYRTLYRIVIGRFVDHFLINGQLTQQYLDDVLHFKHTSKTLGVMSADSFNLQKAVKQIKINDIVEKKESLGILEKGLTYLFVGQIVDRKGISQLLEAWRIHINKHPHDHLIIIGKGILLNKFKKEYINYMSIHLLGAIEYDHLPIYYKLTDVFIIPTLEDNWCLVLPEAMACGLPVACSIYNGGCFELIQNGINGYQFDPLKPKEILNTLEKFHNSNLIEMGRNSVAIESNYTPDKAAKRIFDACRK